MIVTRADAHLERLREWDEDAPWRMATKQVLLKHQRNRGR
jgi:hypothetical protein